MTNLYGATFMRGVDKLDYPYLEMLSSMSEITKHTYLALGESDDATASKVKELPNITIINTVWEDRLSGDGGKIFSEQANIAIRKLREEVSDKEAWVLFLHCDEIIHPNQFELLKSDIERANREGFDSISLRFLHYWKDHYHIAASKRWHPAEIRLFKLNSDIWCFGDAQGFSGSQKRMESDVLIFHYGHVRPIEQHKAKQEEIMKRIRPAQKFSKYWKREQRAFAKTEMLPILILHPEFMKSRIERLGDPFTLRVQEEIYIVSSKIFSESFLSKINTKKIHLVDNVKKVPANFRRESMVILEPSFIERFLYLQPRSVSMKSKHAKDWSLEMELIMRLSQKGVSCQL